MSLPVEFLSGADADLQKIFDRFEDYREGFGAEFMTALKPFAPCLSDFLALVEKFRDRSCPR